MKENIYVEMQEQNICIIPKENHKKTLIWLHGEEEKADDFHDTFATLYDGYSPTTDQSRVIIVNAPIKKSKAYVIIFFFILKIILLILHHFYIKIILMIIRNFLNGSR